MLKRFPYLQGLVWAVILFVLPLPLIQTLAVGLPVIYSSEALAIQVGSIAYVWFLAAIYLATRPKWLDRLIGLPSIYFIHGMLSLFAIVLAYLHKSGTTSNGLIKLTGDWAFDLLIGLMIYSLVFMAGWLTSRVPILKWLKHQLERLFRHELSLWLHRLNLVATVLVFIHVQLISYITAITPYMFLFNAYSAIVLIAYIYSKVQNATLLSPAKLVAKRELAPNFYEFTLQLRHPSRTQILPGDYVFINFPTQDHLRELHPFSVVNHVQSDGQLILAIRGDGDFTRLVQDLRLGTKATIDASYGRFNTMINEHNADELVLVAGGSGVVPMLSLIDAYPDKTITLYYSAHRKDDLIYAEKLQQLANTRPNFTLKMQAGRFEVNSEIDRLPEYQTLYLLSGPAQMGFTWRHALQRHHVSPDQIYYEEFSW